MAAGGAGAAAGAGAAKPPKPLPDATVPAGVAAAVPNVVLPPKLKLGFNPPPPTANGDLNIFVGSLF